MPLNTAQRLLDKEGLIKHVLISNLGGETDGVRHTDAVLDALKPVLDRNGLEAAPSKRDALEVADQEGSAFMSLFTTFGSFSIVAGILLVFLIFVMLSAERRSEMGIARAIGTRRGHLVQMFVYEGLAYDVLAAAVGALLGIAAAFAMVTVLAGALGEFGIEIERQVRVTSIVVSYSIGVLLTLAVVAFSSWRVSRLNIVTAVRGLPDPPQQRGRRRRVAAVALGAVLSVLMIASGISAVDALTFNVGVSLAMMTLIPVARMLGVGERIAYTLGGLGLVVWWLLPFDILEALTGEPPAMDFSHLHRVRAAGRPGRGVDDRLQRRRPARGREQQLRPDPLAHTGPADGGRLSAAKPFPHRRDAGDVHARRLHARHGRRDVGLVHRGLRQRARVRRRLRHPRRRRRRRARSPTWPAAVRATRALADRVDAVASQSVLPVKARQLGTAPRRRRPIRSTGFDDAFLNATTYELAAMAADTNRRRDVWRAHASAARARRRRRAGRRRGATNFDFGVPPGLPS